MINRPFEAKEAKIICLLCAFWSPEGNIKGIMRHGGKCNLKNTDSRMEESCWAWKICSPNQLEQRKEAGLVEEVEE